MEYNKKDFFRLSNLMSLSRMVAAFPFAAAILADEKIWAVVIALYAYISDYLDGFFARKQNEISELGKTLDPLADKIFVGFGSLAMLIMGILPVWFVGLIIVRDLLLLGGGLYAGRKIKFVMPSNYFGKITANFTAVVIIAVYLELQPAIDYGLLISAALLIISFIFYCIRAIKALNKQ